MKLTYPTIFTDVNTNILVEVPDQKQMKKEKKKALLKLSRVPCP